MTEQIVNTLKSLSEEFKAKSLESAEDMKTADIESLMFLAINVQVNAVRATIFDDVANKISEEGLESAKDFVECLSKCKSFKTDEFMFSKLEEVLNKTKETVNF